MRNDIMVVMGKIGCEREMTFRHVKSFSLSQG